MKMHWSASRYHAHIYRGNKPKRIKINYSSKFRLSNINYKYFGLYLEEIAFVSNGLFQWDAVKWFIIGMQVYTKQAAVQNSLSPENSHCRCVMEKFYRPLLLKTTFPVYLNFQHAFEKNTAKSSERKKKLTWNSGSCII